MERYNEALFFIDNQGLKDVLEVGIRHIHVGAIDFYPNLSVNISNDICQIDGQVKSTGLILGESRISFNLFYKNSDLPGKIRLDKFNYSEDLSQMTDFLLGVVGTNIEDKFEDQLKDPINLLNNWARKKLPYYMEADIHSVEILDKRIKITVPFRFVK